MCGEWRGGGTLWTLIVTFYIVIIRCTEIFDHPVQARISFNCAFVGQRKVPLNLIMSFRLSACVMADPNWWISVKFYVAVFYQNLKNHPPPQMGLKPGKIIWHFTWRSNYVLLLSAKFNQHKSALVEWNCMRLLVRPFVCLSVRRFSVRSLVCSSVCLYVSARLHLDRFTRNLKKDFVKICREIPNLVKMVQKYRALYTKT